METTHKDDPVIGGEVLEDTYEGQVSIEKTHEQKYLGFVLSNKGNNMANINCMKRNPRVLLEEYLPN